MSDLTLLRVVSTLSSKCPVNEKTCKPPAQAQEEILNADTGMCSKGAGNSPTISNWAVSKRVIGSSLLSMGLGGWEPNSTGNFQIQTLGKLTNDKIVILLSSQNI